MNLSAASKTDSVSLKKVKCVVWDLDNTIWNGILLEDTNVILKKNIKNIIEEIDRRGILQSIASRNDYENAIKKLKEFQIDEYFLFPQINWDSKSASLKKVADQLNIGIDTFAFIDDQLFEREEVMFVHPEVVCIDAANLDDILNFPELNPKFITEDSRIRRQMYLSEILRKKVEENIAGSNHDFLSSIDLKIIISKAKEEDLKRAEELTERTNQLNTTGYAYSYEELKEISKSEDHIILITGLEDKFGTYGKIGLTLIEKQNDTWLLKLLLMSCRVMSRNVGNVMLSFIFNLAKKNNVKLLAEFLPTDRNRMMYVTYKFAGFKEINKIGDLIILENSLNKIQPIPEYFKIDTDLTVS